MLLTLSALLINRVSFHTTNTFPNYPFLLLTVTAVIVAILVTRHYARKKELMSAWK